MNPKSASPSSRLIASDFDGPRLRRPGMWAVAFIADWCPFCQEFRPVFARIEGQAPFSVALGDVTDLDSPLWEDLRLEVVPTMIAFRDGETVYRKDGIYGVGLHATDVDELVKALAPASARGRPAAGK